MNIETARVVLQALLAIGYGRDVTIVAGTRERAEDLVQLVIELAEGCFDLQCAEAIGSEDEAYSECPLIYARAHEQECAVEDKPKRPLSVIVDHTARQHYGSFRSERVRTVIA